MMVPFLKDMRVTWGDKHVGKTFAQVYITDFTYCQGWLAHYTNTSSEREASLHMIITAHTHT